MTSHWSVFHLEAALKVMEGDGTLEVAAAVDGAVAFIDPTGM